MISLAHCLLLSGLLLVIGIVGVITRRNLIMILLSIEIMLSGSNLAFVSFSRALGDLTGQIMVFFVMIVAATEVAIGLAIAVLLVRQTGKTNADEIRKLKW